MAARASTCWTSVVLLAALPLCLLHAQAASVEAINPRGWKVEVASKEAAHHHSRRALMAHEEHGHTLMATWWADWKAFHGRAYRSEGEEGQAFRAFQDNMRMVHDINANPDLAFWASGNQFSDLTWEQFKLQYLSAPPPADALQPSANATAAAAKAASAASQGVRAGGRRLLQQTFDWRKQGIVTPVRNQGRCNACWVMAGIHALEAAYMIANSLTTPVQFSAQQALDCFPLGGCSWGSAAEFMNTLTRNTLTLESVYPLTSDQTGTTGACQSNLVQQALGGQQVIEYASNTAGYDRFEMEDEPTLIQAMQVNPLVHHFEVDIQFMQYAGGVYSAQTCTGQNLNHALTNYGFNLNEGSWLFKNSWGASWGDNGYVRIKMIGGQGTCGLYRWVFRPSQQFTVKLPGAVISAQADIIGALLGSGSSSGKSKPPRPPPSKGRRA